MGMINKTLARIMQKCSHDNFLDKYLLIISYAAVRVDWSNLKPKLRKFANSKSANRSARTATSEREMENEEKAGKGKEGERDTVSIAERCFAEFTGHVAVGRLILIAIQLARHAFPSVNTPVHPPQIAEFSIKRRTTEGIVNAQQPFDPTVKQNYHRQWWYLINSIQGI